MLASHDVVHFEETLSISLTHWLHVPCHPVISNGSVAKVLMSPLSKGLHYPSVRLSGLRKTTNINFSVQQCIT